MGSLMYESQWGKLCDDLESSHANYYSTEGFGGPSLYFHIRALEDSTAGKREAFTESSYAMLASWGMHRMGQGGAKMADFDEYANSLKSVWPVAQELRHFESNSLGDAEWNALKETFKSIRAMKTNFSLVANSKVLAHLLPNIFPPVDRQYTIPFLNGRKTLPQSIEGEWELFERFLKYFFHPAMNSDLFRSACSKWRETNTQFPWDTSVLKTLDNVLVGHMRLEKRLASMAAQNQQ